MLVNLYNSLSRKIEEFTPIAPPDVGMYTCGPTIYDRKHIGNFRTYTLSDLLFRVFTYSGYKVTHIMNFTDVGHLTGDNEGDADHGEDRMEKAAKRDRKTAWDVASIYEAKFIEDFDKLNLLRPAKFVRATDHISEQIALVEKLEEKGLTYKISDGIYFDTVMFEKNTGKKYGELSTLDAIQEGARVEPNPEKRNPRDFALWKFSPANEKRDMEWDSPWGKGFPGWHIECSAMSMKYLGETFDVHVGGEDLRSTHHPNEIAQSEGATGKQFVRFWIHGAFVLINNERMATSKKNNYNIGDIIEKGFDPISLRYLYFSTHYRKVMNFTWDSLTSAESALKKLREQVQVYRKASGRTSLSQEKSNQVEELRQQFNAALDEDLNMPQALAVVWKTIKSNIPDYDKYDLLLSFDEVLGFGLSQLTISNLQFTIPSEVENLLKERKQAREQKQFVQADEIRAKIEELGFEVKDGPEGQRVKPKS